MNMTWILPALRFLTTSESVVRWRCVGDRLNDALPNREVLLRECFEFMGPSFPSAALTRSLDAEDGGSAQWLRADPAFVMADAVTLRLLACGKMDLSTTEVEALAASLQPLFGDAGFLLEAQQPERWYLRCARETRLPTFSSPEDALGDDLARHLPQGDEARRWRSLLNEVQMTLHDHPVNIARFQRGLPPVNSLWVWGGGVLPAWVKTRFDSVYSDDEVAIALARLARVAGVGSLRPLAAASLGAATDHSATGRATVASGSKSPPTVTLDRILASSRSADTPLASALVDLSRERDLAALQADWFAPANAALRRGHIGELKLLFESGERVTVKRWHRWRLWRGLNKVKA